MMIMALFQNLETECDQVNKSIADLKKQVHGLCDEVEDLKCELKEARVDLNNLEQHGRRWAVRIRGLVAPNDPKKDKAKQLATEFFKNKLAIDIPVNELDCAHHVGAKMDGKQAILVRFHRRDYVDRLIEVRKQLNGTGFTIFEDSTFHNRRLLNRLKNHSDIESSWLIRLVITCHTDRP